MSHSWTVCILYAFHLGHGAANVTLGIPRLREIVMTASTKPKTPSMTLPTKSAIPLSFITTFCKRVSRLTLAQVVDNVTVSERLLTSGEMRRTEFTVRMTFFGKEECREEYDVLPEEVLEVFGARFPLLLKREMSTEMKKLDADLKSQINDLGKGKKTGNDVEEVVDADTREEEEAGGRGEESDGEDGDIGDAKKARQKKLMESYDSDNLDGEDTDGSEMGMDDAADIEATNSSRREDNERAREAAKTDRGRLCAQVAVVSDLFERNFPLGKDFTFSENACTFKVEVSQRSTM
jgi:hypothetical protein